jgi:hemolysin activation/secretion protein
MISYAYYNVNDDVVPTKGFGFSLNGSHTKNLTQTDRSFQRYWTTLGFYLPLSKTISIASRNGLFTVEGEPEFYQYNWLGGGQNLRGFHRQRFYGKTSFYNDNELRWIPDVNAYIFKGKIGLIGFVDNGRVWMPSENSNEWHLGYGGGLLISPFNKLSATIYYGISEDDRLIHIRLGRFF